MDKYDPEKKVALVGRRVGRAGTRRCRAATPGFLAQQNSLRDAVLAALNLNIFARHADRVRMANIAQMVNVLQAMILTDKAKMLLTPDLPRVQDVRARSRTRRSCRSTFDAGRYTHGDIALPRVDAIAAKDDAGTLWLALTNVDPEPPGRHRALNGSPAPGGTRLRRDADRAGRRQREHFRRAERRGAEADHGEGPGRPGRPDARAEVRHRDRDPLRHAPPVSAPPLGGGFVRHRLFLRRGRRRRARAHAPLRQAGEHVDRGAANRQRTPRRHGVRRHERRARADQREHALGRPSARLHQPRRGSHLADSGS